MWKNRTFEYKNNYNVIDIITFIRWLYPKINFIVKWKNELVIKGTDIYIYIWGLKSYMNIIKWISDYSKYETFEERYEKLWYIYDIKRLEKSWKIEEIEELKNTKWLSFKEQEELFNALKKKFQFKHKIKKPEELDLWQKWLYKEKRFLLNWLSWENVHKYYLDNNIATIQHLRTESNYPEIMEKFNEMVAEELKKEDVQKRIKYLNNVEEKANNYTLENYLHVKDLDWNMIDTEKETKELIKKWVKLPYVFYTAEDVVNKIN